MKKNQILSLIRKPSLIIGLLVMVITFYQCTPTAIVEVADPEINGIVLYRVNGTTIIDSFKAIDYTSSGKAIVPDTIKLSDSTTYNFKLKFFSYNPVTKVLTDVTPAIVALGAEHEAFYTPSTSNITITKTDVDKNNNPLGFNTTWVVTTAGNLNVAFFLRHIPTGKTNNSATNASLGGNDISISFPTVIK
ncbi:MAG: hypothetical protein ORN85_05210 [Sediminibacterium sp.]|nr:hypothetical protein [Sediminibacterium sp.]